MKFTKIIWTILVWIVGVFTGYIGTCALIVSLENDSGIVTELFKRTGVGKDFQK